MGGNVIFRTESIMRYGGSVDSCWFCASDYCDIFHVKTSIGAPYTSLSLSSSNKRNPTKQKVIMKCLVFYLMHTVKIWKTT